MCVCVFVHTEVEWPRDLLLLIILMWHEADDQLKILGKHPITAVLWGSSPPHSATASSQTFFHFRSLHHAERQGFFFFYHTHTHAHIPKKTHARTHTRTQYTLLLFINLQGVNWNPPWVSAVPAFPLSLSVKVPLGGNRGGGWWWKESSTVSPVTGQLNIHRSHWIKLCSQLVSASLNGGKKKRCLERNMWIRESCVFAVCRGR